MFFTYTTVKVIGCLRSYIPELVCCENNRVKVEEVCVCVLHSNTQLPKMCKCGLKYNFYHGGYYEKKREMGDGFKTPVTG